MDRFVVQQNVFGKLNTIYKEVRAEAAITLLCDLGVAAGYQVEDLTAKTLLH